MNYQSETPFDNIESAREYVNQLLEATREAQEQIATEVVRAANPKSARRKQALQLVYYKLDKLSSHLGASRRILNDLRTLRRLLLEERKTPNSSAVT
jgi:F0F1-type ATP synthase membrane subunit b/b'